MAPDPTGMWYVPNQTGWGMSVSQQGENIFVVLFIYDGNDNPQWFVASNVVDSGHAVNTLVGEAYSGPLYRTTGPYFASGTDNTTLGVTQVGTIQLAYVQPTGNMSVSYTINGTTVTTTVSPQTWGSNASELSGIYAGGFNIQATANCQPPAALSNVTALSISPGSQPDTVAILWTTSTGGVCQMNGAYSQRGQFGTLNGSVLCGPVGSVNTDSGSFDIEQMVITPAGFSGALTYSSPFVNGSSCAVPGTIGGVKN
jgi:hypothetical protein